MPDSHDLFETQSLDDLGEVLRKMRPTIRRRRTATATVAANIHGEHLPIRKRGGDAVPASPVQASRMHEENGRTFALPFPRGDRRARDLDLSERRLLSGHTIRLDHRRCKRIAVVAAPSGGSDPAARSARPTDRRSAACGDLPSSLENASDHRDAATPHIGRASARPLQRLCWAACVLPKLLPRTTCFHIAPEAPNRFVVHGNRRCGQCDSAPFLDRAM